MDDKAKDQLFKDTLELVRKIDAEKAEKLANVTGPRFVLGAITGGLGIPEVTVRNWLTRGQLNLSMQSQKAKGKWRRFSILDAITISVAFQLSKVGVPVAVYAEIAEFMSNFASNLLTQPFGFAADPILLVFNDGDNWRHIMTDNADIDTLREQHQLPSVFIVLNCMRVMNEALEPLGLPIGVGTADEIMGGADETEEGDK